MVSAIQCMFEHKELPISQGETNQDSLKKKKRPFTLLNAFYKIISSCTSCRIRFTLDNLISETQSGNMKGRYIGANRRFIYDLIAFTESKNIQGLLVLTDFEKACIYLLDLFIRFFLCFWKNYIHLCKHFE